MNQPRPIPRPASTTDARKRIAAKRAEQLAQATDDLATPDWGANAPAFESEEA